MKVDYKGYEVEIYQEGIPDYNGGLLPGWYVAYVTLDGNLKDSNYSYETYRSDYVVGTDTMNASTMTNTTQEKFEAGLRQIKSIIEEHIELNTVSIKEQYHIDSSKIDSHDRKQIERFEETYTKEVND